MISFEKKYQKMTKSMKIPAELLFRMRSYSVIIVERAKIIVLLDIF